MGQQDYMTSVPDLQGLRFMHISRAAHTQLTVAVVSCISGCVRGSSRQRRGPL